MPNLFDLSVALDASPKRHVESRYDYFCRTSRPRAVRVRELLESWFAIYPTSHQSQLKSRFPADFDAAYFELLLHQILVQSGYSIAVEPDVSQRSRRPDFFVKRGQTQLYLEATVATDKTDAERRRDAVERSLYDAINGFASDDYFLRLVSLHIGDKAQPVPRRVRAFLKQLTQKSTWEDATAALATGGLAGLPPTTFEDGDVRMEVALIPKSAAARGQPGLRPIGVYPVQVKRGDSVPAIRSALEEKASGYGILPAPYVIAVNAVSEWGTERREPEEALFGAEEVFDSGTGARRLVRMSDGLFRPGSNTVNQRVAAALVGTAWPWAPAHLPLILYHNPWADTPLPLEVLPFPQVRLSNGHFERLSGPSLHDVLGLPTELSDEPL
jgi:hypothetical protein